MLKKLLLLLLPLNCFAQVPEMIIPEYKHGQDTAFYDAKLLLCDRDEACYFSLTFYYLDKDVWSPKYSWRRPRRVLVTDCPAGNPGHPVMMHGTFKWASKDYETIYAEEYFTNGHNSGITKLYDKKGNVTLQFDYNKRFQNYQWSYYREEFKDNQLFKGIYWYFDTEKYVWVPVEALTND